MIIIIIASMNDNSVYRWWCA